MSDLALPSSRIAQSTIVKFLRDGFNGSRALAINAAIMMIGFVVCVALQNFDGRLLLGINVWDKPAKFFFALGVHLFTAAWALSLITPAMRAQRSVVWAARLMIGAAWAELVYIVFRAARGEASHFNTALPLDAALYAIMGLGALTLTFTAGYIGYRIFRQRQGMIWREAAGIGLMLGTVLGTLTAGYMSSQAGHAVGGAVGDATGLPIFHWSTTGGDLRVAHFVGLHAMQLLPFAALSGKRLVVYGVAIVIVLLTVVTFIQAVLGMPLLQA